MTDPRYAAPGMLVGWAARIKARQCAVCGVQRQKGDHFLQRSVCQERSCRLLWASRIWTWGNFRREYMYGGVGIVCIRCGCKFNDLFQLDHIVPVALHGDPRDLANLQPLCYYCHQRKTRFDIHVIRRYKVPPRGSQRTLR